MNLEQLQALILDVVAEVAPEADLGGIDPDVSFHDQFEIDSVDYLNIMMTLEAKLGLSIPEADYPNLSSLNGCIHYLQPKLAEKARQTAAGSP
ncbi:MAG: acyl carrier protein [Rhodoplanes sp.]|jgi:acyl carrier protein